MKRRTFLGSGSLALAGFSLGCASRAHLDRAPRRPPVRLELPKVSWDRVIRTTVGLRPHRPQGFVLSTEKIADKTIIHNYGHGGSGMSLSWGTAHMAADMALEHLARRAAVLGCGVVGLTSARELQRRGFDVTIYAASVPPETTSNMSLAGFTPTSGLVEFRSRTPEWEAQFRKAVTIAYHRLQLLIGPKYGVSWIVSYTPTNDERAASGHNVLLPEEADVGQELLMPGEHPFPTKYAVMRPFLRFEPSIYLDALVHDFVTLGGRIVIRKFDSPRDVVSLTESLVINATGLGSRALFEDEQLVPLKGQLTAVIPQPEIDYGTNGGLRTSTGQPGIGIHMMPRSDGIILGGTSERDNWSLDVNEEERKRIVEGHMELYGAMRALRGPST